MKTHLPKSNYTFLLHLIVFFLLAAIPKVTLATHIVGGDLEYRCLGNNLYEITLTLRRDCINGQATFDNPAHIGIFNSSGLLLTQLGNIGVLEMFYNPDDTLNEYLVKTCGIVGGDVCVHTTIYRETVELPFLKGGYILAYQRCCRNFTIQNIVDPLKSGATYTLEIKDEALQSCNSSPKLGKYPPIYICGGQDIEFNLKAFDSEGDSLVYRMCAPYVGANQTIPLPNPPSRPPYQEVIFDAPYSLKDMIGGNPPLNIGQSTGVMRGYALPNIAQFLIAYCIEEYRDGKLLSIMRRDFQINVRLCNSAPVAEFKTEYKNCKLPLSLICTDQSSDRYSTIKNLEWTLESSNGKFVSNLKNPIFNLNVEGIVKLRLIVESDVMCRDTIEKEINIQIVKPEIVSRMDTICRLDSVELKGNYPSSFQYQWFPSTGLSCSNCPNPKASPSVSTTYVLRSTNGDCQRADTIDVIVKSCIIDPCEVQIQETCLQSGMIEVKVVDDNGILIKPKLREQELFWDISESTKHPKYVIQNQNPILLFNRDKYSLTSKYYSWPLKGPKTIENAKICTRRIGNTLSKVCQGPCEDIEFILSSCEDDYDKINNLNFPAALCQSICSDQCNFIVALFEKNGQLINPSDYQIKWSTGSSGSYVNMMQPYFNTLTVEVRKGDCIWRGRYWKKCDRYTKFSNFPDLSSRTDNEKEIDTNFFNELVQNGNMLHILNLSGQIVNKKTSDFYTLPQGWYIIFEQNASQTKVYKYFKN